MEKVSIIADTCDDLLLRVIHLSEDTMNHLVISAVLIEDYIFPPEVCKAVNSTAFEAAKFIKKHIGKCNQEIQNDVYVLLVELEGTTH